MTQLTEKGEPKDQPKSGYSVFEIPPKEIQFLVISTIISIIALIGFELVRNRDYTTLGLIIAVLTGFVKGCLVGFVLTTIKRLIQSIIDEEKRNGAGR